MSGIFPHNSSKCHCPECNKVREQVGAIADDRIAVEREACNETRERFGRHALRRKMHADAATKRLEAMDIARTQLLATGPKTDAAADNTRYTLAAADNMRYLLAACGDPETFEEHWDRVLCHQGPRQDGQYVCRAGPYTAWSRRTYYDKSENQMFHWKWRRGLGWMKRATGGRIFGPRYRRVRFLPDGFRAWPLGARIGSYPECYTEAHGQYAGEGVIGNATINIKMDEVSENNLRMAFTGRAAAPQAVRQAVERSVKHGGSLAQSVAQMRNPGYDGSWVQKTYEDITTPAWTACKPPVGTYLDLRSGDALRFTGAVGGPRLKSGAKTGRDAEDNSINLEGESMISALKLSILTFRAAHPTNIDYPMTPSTQRNVRSALRQLHEDQLIINENDKYVLSDRGRVLVEAMQNLALPTRPEPKWVMPHTK